MAKTRIRNLKLIQSVVLPYHKSRSGEAAKLYAKTRCTIQKWQKLLLDNILALNYDGLWVHTKFGYSVSRRNGKNERLTTISDYTTLKPSTRKAAQSSD